MQMSCFQFFFFLRLIGPAVCLPANGTHKQRLMQTNSKKNILTTLMLNSQTL